MLLLKTLLMIAFGVIAVALVALILVQCGRGAGIGAAFGSGASNTVFGSRGSGNFLTRTTGVLGTLFFAVCLVLTYISSVEQRDPDGVLAEVLQEEAPEAAPEGELPEAGAEPGEEEIPGAASEAAAGDPGEVEQYVEGVVGRTVEQIIEAGAAREDSDVPELPVSD